MIKDIVKDEFFLSMPSLEATDADKECAIDLVDTLNAHALECVGLAANMIGIRKNIIVIRCEDESVLVMFNPEIIKKENRYETEEGCLSLKGTRKTIRYQKIKVAYQDIHWKKKIKTFIGFEAQIIQHEIDHCQGILI